MLLELAADALHDRALGFHLAAEANPRRRGCCSTSPPRRRILARR
jgi:hypothetical protein